MSATPVSRDNVGPRRMLSGTQPPPMLSSAALGWPDLRVEVYRQHDVDVVTQSAAHVVTVQLSGTRELYQERGGRSSTQTLHPGSVIITPVGEPKHWRHAEPADILIMRLSVDAVNQVAQAISDGGCPGPELRDDFGTRDPFIEQLGRRLVEEVRSPDPLSPLFAQAAAQQLAIHLLRHHSGCGVALSGVKLTRKKLRAATDFIEAHLDEDVTLAAIAQAVGLSPCHFAHAFKDETGMAPHRYVMHRRIERAKTLLRETTLHVAEVGYRVGYPNQSHFSVAFQRVAGVTPSAWRAGA